jgi:hypothetical protein
MSQTSTTDESEPHPWMVLLNNYVQSQKQNTDRLESERETTSLFLAELAENNKNNNSQHSFPKFFYKNPSNCTQMHLTMRSEAKQKFLSLKAHQTPEKTDLTNLLHLLKENASPPKDGNERINYSDFTKVKSKVPLFNEYFSACNFLKFDKDKYGRIDILAFFHYIVRRNSIEENKIHLSFFDFCGEGYLLEKDLEFYITREMQNFPFINTIEKNKQDLYVLHCLRKFCFCLDQKNKGKINIDDIVTSNILNDFLEMTEPTYQTLTKAEINMNWFSKETFEKVCKKYIMLKTKRNNLLSKQELVKYSPGLTNIFIDRIFEEYQTYENAFTYKDFLDFVLAMENKKHKASIQYIWRAIDVYHKNAVDTFVINMFFRAIAKKLALRDKGEYKIDDVKDEIWDMIKPKNKNYFTLQDVLNSPYGDVVLSLLIDAKSFYYHDQKEYMIIDEFMDMDEEY